MSLGPLERAYIEAVRAGKGVAKAERELRESLPPSITHVQGAEGTRPADLSDEYVRDLREIARGDVTPRRRPT